MVKTRKMTNKCLENAIKKHKIRNCSVKLVRPSVNDNLDYKKALFRMHRIRDFHVNLHRLTADEIVALTTVKKKFSAYSKVKSVRFHVSRLPDISNTNTSTINAKNVARKRTSRTQSLHEQSTNDITANAAMHGECLHDVPKSTPHKAKLLPARRQRSSSVLEERPKPTNEDFHSELLKKVNTPNRSLMPAGRRSIPDPKPVPLPEWKRIFNEFQEKAAEQKKAK